MTQDVSDRQLERYGAETRVALPTALLLLVAALIGWFASVALTIDQFKLLSEPNYRPSCNINPILSCGSVMATHDAEVFGFPNSIVGVIGFSAVVTLAVVAVAGVVLPRWMWRGMWLGVVAGLAAIGWMIYHALYVIHVLCPYCMVVWTVTPLVFAAVTRHLWGAARGVLGLLADWRWTLVAVFYAVVALLIFLRFQDYWMSLL